jgi:hypothetical protein
VIRYVDSAGWTWEVCELADRPAPDAPAAAAPTARTGPSSLPPGLADAPLDSLDVSGELYFFSRVGARKLREYPPTWTQLSRDGLEALCDRAQDLDGMRAI